MLNHFKIGTKLIGGFSVVLLLLLVVWLTGLWAVIQKTAMAKQVATAEALITAGLSMQRDILEAMNAVNLETLTKEKSWADQVQTIATRIQTDRAGDFELIKQANVSAQDRTKIETQYRTLLNKVAEFARTDASAWATELERQAAVDERIKLAAATMTEMDELSALINEAIHGAAITQNNATFYPATFTDRKNLVDQMTSAIRDIRRLCYQYTAATEEKEKTEHRGDIVTEFAIIAKNIDLLKQQLELPATQQLLVRVADHVNKWHESVNAVMDLEVKYAGFDARTTVIAEELIKGINDLLPVFHGLAKTEVENGEIFDRFIQWTLTIVSLIAIAFGGIISFTIAQNISHPMKVCGELMNDIAVDGDLEKDVPKILLDRGDEIGGVAQNLKLILDENRVDVDIMTELANGNWTRQIRQRSDLDKMNKGMEGMIQQVNNILHEIIESVKQVATGSNEVSNAAQSLSSGAQESAASLEQITASMSEISSQTKANAESAGRARDLAHQASQAAGEGQTAMHNMTEAMGRITANSNEIQRVIKVIDDIAFQTNLLALNAAVEAARAGQHGKGFAVVAEEVRNLAARSAKAARETSELIAKSSQEIEQGGEVATHTAEVLNTIVDQVKQTTELVAGIATASNEQAQGVNQVSIGLTQIDTVTQQNTAAAEESASAANEMSSMATTLQKLVGQFKLRP